MRVMLRTGPRSAVGRGGGAMGESLAGPRPASDWRRGRSRRDGVESSGGEAEAEAPAVVSGSGCCG